MKKIIFILVSVLISSTATRAVNRTWVGTNNQWLVTNFSPSTGTLSSADNITIPTVTAPFVYPVLSASKTCNDLTFTGNGRITCPSGKQITITGNLTNSTSGPGVFLGGREVIFSGSNSKTATGSTDFTKVTVNKTGSTTLTLSSGSNFTISKSLLITAGDIVTNSANLTLLSVYDNSNGWTTAYIDGTGGGNISGECNVQSALYGYDNFKTYHEVCSPVKVSGTSYWGTWMVDDDTQGSDYYSSTYNFYYGNGSTIPDWLYYDETPSGVGPGSTPNSSYGWKGRNVALGSSSNTDTVKTMQGALGRFVVNVDGGTGDNLPLDWTGVVNNGSVTSPTLYYTSANGQSGIDGVNCIGNPYPSPISWDVLWARLDGAGGNHVLPTVWVWQNDGATELGGTYLTRDATDGSGTLSTPDIAIGQGFFITVDQNSYTFTMENTDRVADNTTAYYRQSSNEKKLSFQIKLQGEVNNDVTAFYFGDYKKSYDKYKDAAKLINPGNSLYSLAGDVKIACNYLPIPTDETIIPIELILAKGGVFTLLPRNLQMDDAKYTLIFEDRKEHKFLPFNENFQYAFNGKAGLNEDRFFIHVQTSDYALSAKTTTFGINSFYSNGKVFTVLPEKNGGQLTLTDLSGRIIQTMNCNNNNGMVSMDVSTLSKGIYLVSLSEKNGSFKSQKVAIND